MTFPLSLEIKNKMNKNNRQQQNTSPRRSLIGSVGFYDLGPRVAARWVSEVIGLTWALLPPPAQAVCTLTRQEDPVYIMFK